jgi:membrane protein
MAMSVTQALKEAAKQWWADQASFLGAAIAYYAVFSVAPLCIVAVTIAGWVYGEAAARDQVFYHLRDYLGPEAAQGVQDMIVHAWSAERTAWATALGVAVLLYTAANLFLQLRTGLSLIWRLPVDPAASAWRGTARNYFIALVMVVLIGLFLLLLVAAGMVATITLDAIGQWLPGGAAYWRGVNFGVMFIVLTVALIMTYRLLSNRRIPYRDLIGGAAVTALLFTIGKLLFGLYLSYMGKSMASSYGAASSLVIFLVWVYYSAQMVFYGAEYIKVRMMEREGNGRMTGPVIRG